MSLEFVSGALFALGLMLIGQWLRDRWRYRRADRTLPSPRPLPANADVEGVGEPGPPRRQNGDPGQ